MTEPSQNQAPAEGTVVDLPLAGPTPAAAPAPAPTITLDEVEQDVGQVDEAMGWARVAALKWDIASRVFMVFVIALIFVGLNWMVMQFLRDAFVADLRMMDAKPPTLQAADRLITSNLLMTLIGATVVQVGVSIAAIVSYLFPKTNNHE